MANNNSVAIRLTPSQRRALGRWTGLEHVEISFQTTRTPRGYAGVALLTTKAAPAGGINPRMPFKVALNGGSRPLPFKLALAANPGGRSPFKVALT